jgi:hypothetical protein
MAELEWLLLGGRAPLQGKGATAAKKMEAAAAATGQFVGEVEAEKERGSAEDKPCTTACAAGKESRSMRAGLAPSKRERSCAAG